MSSDDRKRMTRGVMGLVVGLVVPPLPRVFTYCTPATGPGWAWLGEGGRQDLAGRLLLVSLYWEVPPCRAFLGL